MKKTLTILSLIILFSINVLAQEHKCCKQKKDDCKSKKECQSMKKKNKDNKTTSLEAQPSTVGNTTTTNPKK